MLKVFAVDVAVDCDPDGVISQRDDAFLTQWTLRPKTNFPEGGEKLMLLDAWLKSWNSRWLSSRRRTVGNLRCMHGAEFLEDRFTSCFY